LAWSHQMRKQQQENPPLFIEKLRALKAKKQVGFMGARRCAPTVSGCNANPSNSVERHTPRATRCGSSCCRDRGGHGTHNDNNSGSRPNYHRVLFL